MDCMTDSMERTSSVIFALADLPWYDTVMAAKQCDPPSHCYPMHTRSAVLTCDENTTDERARSRQRSIRPVPVSASLAVTTRDPLLATHKVIFMVKPTARVGADLKVREPGIVEALPEMRVAFGEVHGMVAASRVVLMRGQDQSRAESEENEGGEETRGRDEHGRVSCKDGLTSEMVVGGRETTRTRLSLGTIYVFRGQSSPTRGSCVGSKNRGKTPSSST